MGGHQIKIKLKKKEAYCRSISSGISHDILKT